MNIYADHAATCPLSHSMQQYLSSIFSVYGNPASLYTIGQEATKIVEQSREKVAEFIHTDPSSIVFTPSASASTTLAIHGFIRNRNMQGVNVFVFYSPISHQSMLNAVNDLPANNKVFSMKVDKQGFLDIEYLEKQLFLVSCDAVSYIVLDAANSVIGTVQDIYKICKLAKKYNAYLYLDCTAYIPSFSINIKKLPGNILIGFGGHKLGALKGIGVLYKPRHIPLSPLIYGEQEQGLVGGTLPIVNIASLGKAMEEFDYSSISLDNSKYLWRLIRESVQDCYLVGPSIENNRLPLNLFICFRGVYGESLMMLLDMNGIMVSTGTACSSGDTTPSSTLTAIKMPSAEQKSCIRITLSGKETKEELYYICKNITKSVSKLRYFN